MWLAQSQLPPWAIAGCPVPARKERGCRLLGSGSFVALAFPLGPIGSRFLLKSLIGCISDLQNMHCLCLSKEDAKASLPSKIQTKLEPLPGECNAGEVSFVCHSVRHYYSAQQPSLADV